MSEATEPVTVVVTRRVKQGREQAYEDWLARLIASAHEIPGYLGTNVHRPSTAGPREYTTVFRFDSVESLRVFEESEVRRRALLEVVDLVESDAVWRKLTGLEFWFSPPPGTVVPQPSKFRMAIVMIGVVYGLVLSIGTLVALVLGVSAADSNPRMPVRRSPRRLPSLPHRRRRARRPRRGKNAPFSIARRVASSSPRSFASIPAAKASSRARSTIAPSPIPRATRA